MLIALTDAEAAIVTHDSVCVLYLPVSISLSHPSLGPVYIVYLGSHSFGDNLYCVSV